MQSLKSWYKKVAQFIKSAILLLVHLFIKRRVVDPRHRNFTAPAFGAALIACDGFITLGL
jgi:hypothetical protein